MLTIDEIKIEGEEDGFVLTIHFDGVNMIRHRIGLPDQFLSETERTIGAWLAEGERLAMQHKLDQGYQPDSRNVELDEAWDGEAHDAQQWAQFHHPESGDPDLARDLERGK